MSFSYKAIQPISSYSTQEHNKGGFCEVKRFVHLQCVPVVGKGCAIFGTQRDRTLSDARRDGGEQIGSLVCQR